MRYRELFEDDAKRTWYHATSYDFDEFVPSSWRGATYFSPTPEGAIRGASAGGMEHPALSGPTTANARQVGFHIVPCFIKGKIWGEDPLPLEWFPEHMSYGEYKKILANDDPIHIPRLGEKENNFLNRIRNELIPLIYMEAVLVEEYDKYVDDKENDLPLVRDALPIPKPFFSYTLLKDLKIISGMH